METSGEVLHDLSATGAEREASFYCRLFEEGMLLAQCRLREENEWKKWFIHRKLMETGLQKRWYSVNNFLGGLHGRAGLVVFTIDYCEGCWLGQTLDSLFLKTLYITDKKGRRKMK